MAPGPTRRAPRTAGAAAHGDTRERLLAAGERCARRAGLRTLTVRGVCGDAGANLGSFVYHFGSRDAFVAAVIERRYAPLLDSLAVTVDSAEPPLARLRALLVQLADWLATHRRFVTHVLMDAAAGEPAAARFVRTLAGRHPALILRVIGEAQAARALPRAEPINVLMYLMGSLALPLLLAERLSETQLTPAALTRALARYAQERAFRLQRLDWALAGLSMEGTHEPDRTPRAAR
jgi:AcrR family transcriptional regulator